MIDQSELAPGDILLYRGEGLFGWFTRTKTWSDVGHVEIYVGTDTTITASAGKGVDFHPLRLNEALRYVRRPIHGTFNLQKAIKWFMAEAKGQKYDGWGLIRSFFNIKQDVNNKRMFCSEISDRLLRAGDIVLFDPCIPPDAVAPAQFKQTPDATTRWSWK